MEMLNGYNFNTPTIAQFKKLCEKHPDEVVSLKPVFEMSWRGYYYEAAVEVRVGDAKLSEYIKFLDNLVNTLSYYGWKGGDYSYNEDTPLHFEFDASLCEDTDDEAWDGTAPHKNLMTILTSNCTVFDAAYRIFGNE